MKLRQFLLLPLALAPLAFAEETTRHASRALPVNLAQWLAGLATVLIAIAVLVVILRRLSHVQRLQPGAFRVLGALSVGSRERVVLLQLGDRQLVLGVAPGQVQTLCELTGDAAIQSTTDSDAASGLPSFAQRLAALRKDVPS